jgi:hypothetical protein
MEPSTPIEIVADLCRVAREGHEVVIHFGQGLPADAPAGAVRALALQRIALGDSGAAKMQDLLTELLRAPPAGTPSGR